MNYHSHIKWFFKLQRIARSILVFETKKKLKIGLSLSKKICYIFYIESPLKMMKNTFYFIWKALFVLKIFNFCLDFWSCGKNGLIRKIRLISKFMTSQPGQQTIAIDILNNISRSKDNQAMKFGQLIEYIDRKLCWKWGKEASSNLSIF